MPKANKSKSAPKTTRDHYRAGPFYFKWKRPDGSIKVTQYEYDPKNVYVAGRTRKAWMKFCRETGESLVGWKYLGLAKPSEYEAPLKFT